MGTGALEVRSTWSNPRVYVNNDPGSEWTATGMAQPSLLSSEEPAESLEPMGSHSVGAEDLLAFLSDFRTGHDRGGAPSPVGDEEVPSFQPSAGWGGYDVAHTATAPEEPEAWDPYQGSGTQVAPDWWVASDGRWYPPELHPDRQAEAAAPPAGPESTGAGSAAVSEMDPLVAAARAETPDPKVRLSVGLPRLRRLRQSPATA